MVFSSTVFIFFFLPIVLLVSLLLPRRAQNVWLLITSLAFYAWGGVSYSIILIGSLVMNYAMGLLLDKFEKDKKKVLGIGVGLNLVVLVIFKYADFITENLNSMLGTEWPLPNIKLPIGISFFTFQAISYLVDVYRRETKVQKNLVDLSLYISLFPQLIAGPIVRYHDIALQLKNRTKNWQKIASGIERFIIGLGKKVLLANTFAVIADEIFNADPTIVTPTMAVVGAICYSFQIYFDFAGYSDMAIGLGRMLGFEFKENFNFPYVAKSIQEFWRRWHISLSTWFRDYLYIPLGGNRVSSSRVYINLFLVFLCTGFWHGASWNFIFWGLFHGLFLVIERVGFGKVLKKLWQPLPQVYMLLIVVIGWIFFRAETLDSALTISSQFIKGLWLFNWQEAIGYVQKDLIIALVFGILSMMGFMEKFLEKTHTALTKGPIEIPYGVLRYTLLFGILFICMSFLSAQTYNPFIYFRF